MQYKSNLPAGQWVQLRHPGAYFVLLSTGAAATVALRVMRNGQELESFTEARRGLKMRLAEPFTHVEMQAGVNALVEFVVSDGAVEIDSLDGANVNATITGLPLPVSNDRGAPGNPVSVTAVTVADAPAVSINEPAAVAVTAALTPVVAANVNRAAVRFANLDAVNDVAIGAAGLTWAKRCIVLGPGDVFVEDRAANLAWQAICDAGKTATVGVQEVMK